MIKVESRNLWLLVACQSLFVSVLAIDLILTGVMGQKLAPQPAMATLPFALITVGGALITGPAARLMQSFGRQAIFLAASVLGVLGGLLSATAVYEQSFATLCAGSTLLGMFYSIAQYYRFAAADQNSDGQKARAISTVLIGSVLGAILGPFLFVWSKGLLPDLMFAGAYLTAAGLAAFSLLLLAFYKGAPAAPPQLCDKPLVLRQPYGFLTLFKRPVYLVAIVNGAISNAVMLFVMTVASLASLASCHSIDEGAAIMQWHLVGMYAPAFVSSVLIKYAGAAPVMLFGAILCTLCAGVATAGSGLLNFEAAMFCLGVGWNLMFVASSTLLVQADDARERLWVQGWSEFIRYVLMASASLASGAVLQQWGWSGINWVILVPLGVAAGTSIWWMSSRSYKVYILALRKAA
ncbi:MFS transporter [Variovorax saccharolyticus]|uniref:MFS transporter n=1 Tax=Variovorax saccharolyticus TaxID=3053516 RepID=UPI00257732BB|nr:MFS transporter [Variovorax sp. J31P216]MDM0029106.1 MFS transporter [Variovorax sp. J31P216]